MKTLILEHPRLPSGAHFNDIANTPLWSCLLGGYSAACLAKKGLDVLYLDAPAESLNFRQTQKRVKEAAPELLAVNVVYFWEETGQLFEFFKAIRQDGFHGHLCVFGFFPSLAWQRILEDFSEIDSVIVGECEDVLTELCLCLTGNSAWQQIEGLASRSDDRTQLYTKRSPRRNLDALPLPWRLSSTKNPAILASRGCYNHCSFCPIPSFYNQGPLWRGRSSQNILSEIRQLQENGFSDFYFVDANFVGPGKAGRRRTMELLAGLKELQITFGMETRPNDLDDELMAHLVDAGLKSLLIGIESGTGKGLKNLDKHCSVNRSEKALSLCRKYGIEPEIGFIMFTPETSLDDLRENLSFLKRNRLLDRLDRTANLLCHQQIILAGTSGYQYYEQEGRLQPTGICGFEGRVDFLDSGSAWVAEVMTGVCHSLLKGTGDTKSSLFWQHAKGYHRFQEVNNVLVDCFQSTLEMAGRSPLPEARQVRVGMISKLQELIKNAEKKLG